MEWEAWLERYLQRLQVSVAVNCQDRSWKLRCSSSDLQIMQGNSFSPEERRQVMNRTNPKYVLR